MHFQVVCRLSLLTSQGLRVEVQLGNQGKNQRELALPDGRTSESAELNPQRAPSKGKSSTKTVYSDMEEATKAGTAGKFRKVDKEATYEAIQSTWINRAKRGSPDGSECPAELGGQMSYRFARPSTSFWTTRSCRVKIRKLSS